MAQMTISERLDAIGRGENPDLADIVCRDAKDEIEALRDDCLRLHRDKMAFYEAALALVHSETIKNVCGWYSEIEAFRKLLGATPAKESANA